MGAPILTTNFDLNLPGSSSLSQFFISRKRFSDFYPWSTYFGDRQLVYPTDGFGVWYINGFLKYPRSIRLGLTDYMGSVGKSQNLLHEGNAEELFSGKDQNKWAGLNTWMHIIFNKAICIFGLGLEENEVFLRWLLIERAKYFKQYPERRQKGWYVAPKKEFIGDGTGGKEKFLKGMGIKIIETEDYHEIYRDPWK